MTQAETRMHTPPRRGPTLSGKTAVLVLAAAAVATITIIIVVVYATRDKKPLMDVPAVGAGAGETGMYNEYQKKKKAPTGERIPQH